MLIVVLGRYIPAPCLISSSHVYLCQFSFAKNPPESDSRWKISNIHFFRSMENIVANVKFLNSNSLEHKNDWDTNHYLSYSEQIETTETSKSS